MCTIVDHDAAAQADRLLTPDETASLLGCDRDTVIKMIDNGDLTAIRLPSAKGKGQHYRISLTSLLTWFGHVICRADKQITDTSHHLEQAAADLRAARKAHAALLAMLQPQPQPADLLTIDEAASRLAVSRRRTYYLIQNGWLNTITLPSRGDNGEHGQRIPAAEIPAFIARLTQERPEPVPA